MFSTNNWAAVLSLEVFVLLSGDNIYLGLALRRVTIMLPNYVGITKNLQPWMEGLYVYSQKYRIKSLKYSAFLFSREMWCWL